MRKLVKRGFFAALAAGVTLSTLGLAGASVAQAQTGPPKYTENEAGYLTGGGRFFRFVATDAVVPSIPGGATSAHSLAIIRISGHGEFSGLPASASIRVPAGGGPITYTVTGAAHPFGMNAVLGHSLRMSIFFNQAGRDSLTVLDRTTGASRTVTVSVGRPIYTRTEVVGHLLPSYTVSGPDIRLWAFRNARVTTYSGARGTLLGPWTTREEIMVTEGGTVIANASVLWNSGANFGVWERGS